MLNEHYLYVKRKKVEYKGYYPVFSPALNSWVVFASDGFNHLLFSRKRRRSIKEQVYKLSLQNYAQNVIKKARKHDGYRKITITPYKYTEYWSLSAFEKSKKKMIKVIVKRINGRGHYFFWSLM